jgi:hypothetical protein
MYKPMLLLFSALFAQALFAVDAVVVDSSGNTSINGAMTVVGGAQFQDSVRLIPRATSGPPVSGTWNAGTLITDSANDLWQCTVASTPGPMAWRKLNLTAATAPLFVDVRKPAGAAQAVTAYVTNIRFTLAVENPGAAWNTDTFTCPSSGLYLISGQWVTQAVANWNIYKNGTSIADGGVNNPYNPINYVVRLTANDTITFRSTVSTSVIDGLGNANRMTFTRLGD